MEVTFEQSPIQRIRRCVSGHEGQLVASFEDVSIRSAFQPIYSLVHARMVGVEGLMRCTSRDGSAVSPLQLLNRPGRGEAQDIFLDRLCRYLHLNNMVAHVPDAYWLFMNVSAQTVIAGRRYGSYFEELLKQLDFPAHRVVVEILEDGISDERLLAEAVDYYRELGCIIAIDDFGAGNSNFNRVWEIHPDIVKLDRSLVVRAATDIRTRRALPNLVELLRESGCLVLMEGIETEAEAVIAAKSGVDMVQGYYFAKPTLTAQPVAPIPETMRHIQDEFIRHTRDAAILLGSTLKPHIELFQAATNRINQGEDFAATVAGLTAMPLVRRCYMLDQDGFQLGESVVSGNLRAARNRFEILTSGKGADWSTRSYFRRAIQHPGQIQITEPYLSIADADTCMTLSVAISMAGRAVVLCCDLRVPEG
jgi:EAL domain-containing protein (putative c-di-GMP-specific phosphodiesterase class I)